MTDTTMRGDFDQLVAWLAKSGRQYIILNATDVVNALRGSPEQVDDFIGILSQYEKYRTTFTDHDATQIRIAGGLDDGTTMSKTSMPTSKEINEIRQFLDVLEDGSY